MNNRTLFKLTIKVYIYRLVIASVHLVMAFAISNTDTRAGVASTFVDTGLKAGFVQFIVFILFIIGGVLVVLPKHHIIDFFILLPMILMSYFSIVYGLNTGNITAPTVYLIITALLSFILSLRWQHESIH